MIRTGDVCDDLDLVFSLLFRPGICSGGALYLADPWKQKGPEMSPLSPPVPGLWPGSGGNSTAAGVGGGTAGPVAAGCRVTCHGSRVSSGLVLSALLEGLLLGLQRLALPSPRTGLSALCPGLGIAQPSAGLLGSAVGPELGEPLAGGLHRGPGPSVCRRLAAYRTSPPAQPVYPGPALVGYRASSCCKTSWTCSGDAPWRWANAAA